MVSNDSEYDPTGITTITTASDLKSGNCYDLSGRYVSRDAMKPGIYIWNGKKYTKQ